MINIREVLNRCESAIREDMSDLDPIQDYDTRVKLPDWQLRRLRKPSRAKDHDDTGQTKKLRAGQEFVD